MGTCEKVLGRVDQLLIDNAIMGEVREHHDNLAVAYYEKGNIKEKYTTWSIMTRCWEYMNRWE